MFTVLNTDKFMGDSVLLELLGHHDGLLVWHVGVLRAVNHHRWRIVLRDIFHCHVGMELLFVLMRIPSGDRLRPFALLTAWKRSRLPPATNFHLENSQEMTVA